MKNLILLIVVFVILLVMFRSFYSERFTLGTAPTAPFYGDVETDDDTKLINEVTTNVALTLQCTNAKTLINKGVQKLRDDLRAKKLKNQTSLSECSTKVPTQITRYKKLFNALNGREPTAREINDNVGYIIPKYNP